MKKKGIERTTDGGEGRKSFGSEQLLLKVYSL